MSQFSGKCDLYDSVIMIGKYDVKNIRLFIRSGERHYPIKIEEPKDLIPYYPYVPYISTYSDGIYKAYLSDSYIDVEERQYLNSQLSHLLREYRKCKRKKIPFDIPSDSCWYNKVLIKRVKEQGEKATIENIHLPMSNYWRKTLAQEMKKNGYSNHEIVHWVYPDKLFEDWDWHTEDY